MKNGSVQHMKFQLIEIANQHELEEFEKMLEEKESEWMVSMAFLGEFKSGKSTIINCLLGEKILPVAEEPTTHAITEIVGNDKDSYFILKNDDVEEEIPRSKIGYYIAGEGAKEVKKVILKMAERGVIKKGIIIVDTPGISSLNEVDEKITYGYLPLVDAAFIVVNINYGTLPSSLLSFLKEKVLQEDIVKMFFILNFADTKTPENNEKIKNEVIKLLKKEEIAAEPVVIVLSAKDGIEGLSNPILWKKSNMEQLIKIIQEEIIERKKRLVEKKVKEHLLSVAQNMKSILEEKLNGFTCSSDELDKKIVEIRESMEKLENEKRKWDEKFFNLEMDIREKINNIVEISTPLLISSVVKEGTVSEEVLEHIKRVLENTLNSINIYLDELADKINTTFQFSSRYLKDIIMDKVGVIHKLKEVAVTLADFAIVAYLIPGGFLGKGGKAASMAGKKGAGVMFKEAIPYLGEVGTTILLEQKKGKTLKDTQSRKAKILNILNFVAGVLEKLNIPKVIGDIIEKRLIKEKVKNALWEALNNLISLQLYSIKNIVDKKIEELTHAVKGLERALSNLKDERKQRIETQEERKKRIKTDLETLTKFIEEK